MSFNSVLSSLRECLKANMQNLEFLLEVLSLDTLLDRWVTIHLWRGSLGLRCEMHIMAGFFFLSGLALTSWSNPQNLC